VNVPPVLRVLLAAGVVLLSIAVLDPSALLAQGSASVSGRVLQEGGRTPLAGVSVEVLGSNQRTLTDGSGSFVLRGLEPGEVTLRFRRLGFLVAEERVELGSGGVRGVEAVLTVDAIGVDPLVVLARRTRMVGDPLGRNVTPGSAHFLSRLDLQEQPVLFDDVHAALRRIPGVNIQDEEGFGLRPNIGLRGTGAERSSKVTLMEDGILIAPAPYAAPAAYFVPTLGRMEGIEVRKGSSQIRYGPRTIGGAINFLSTPIPERMSWSAELGGGGYGSVKGRGYAGGSGVHHGWLVETYQMATEGFKELPGGGDTGFRLQDYVGKLRLNTRRDARLYQEVELKVGYVEQASDETYLGLTDADFASTPLRRYAASSPDVITTDHRQASLRHFFRGPGGVDLTTTAYGTDFSRNWYKLQSVGGRSLAAVLDDPERYAGELAILRGASSVDDALRVRANNRAYSSRGIQSVLGLRGRAFGAGHDLEVGVRVHRDDEDRFQWEDGYRMENGSMVLTSEGTPGTQTNRVVTARAVAFFVQDEVELGPLTLTPGLRYETIDFEDVNWGAADLGRDGPGTVRENGVTAWVPGVGAAYRISPALHFFGGLHRGFGPPGPGANEETRPEESWNWEGGARFRRGSLGVELAGFFSDYRNILGEETLASGTPGSGELYNGGRVDVKGLELSLEADLAVGRGLPVRLPLRAVYSYTDAVFGTSFSSDFEPWGEVQAGDELPYMPRHQASGSLGVRGDRWALTVTAQGTGQGRTVAGSGPMPEGRRTDRYLVTGLSGEIAVVPDGVLFFGIQNLTDEAYAVARRPAGLRPGLPRTIQAGVRIRR
jgi:Fe(3+) dicitrate transport protein